MSRLIIVGAGLAGSSLARAAEAAGHTATVVCEQEPSTKAALALLRPSHLPPGDREHLGEALAAWASLGVETVSGGTVTHWRRDDERFQRDWFAIDPTYAMRAPDIVAHAEPHAHPGTVAIGEKGTVTGDAVVWCTADGEGRRTYGHTWVHDSPDALAHPGLRLHHLGPYKVLAGVAYATGARIGSSSASTPEASMLQARGFLETAIRLGWVRDLDGWRLIGGTRLSRTSRLAHRPDGSWDWSGFHRTGFGTAPVEAAAVVRKVLP